VTARCLPINKGNADEPMSDHQQRRKRFETASLIDADVETKPSR
jgi:hypothetical protein